MDYEENDSLDSILTEIESSLRSTYPSTGEKENQVYSAYHDDVRTVGYGRSDAENFVTYNNPFDPRLTFNGLGGCIKHPDVTDEKHGADMTENVFLALYNPTQLMDKYLNGYRSFVRGLCASPGSGDWLDSTVECRRLYDRISSDNIKSIWKTNLDTDENKEDKTSKEVKRKESKNPSLRAPKTRQILKQIPSTDVLNNQVAAEKTEARQKLKDGKEYKIINQRDPEDKKSKPTEETTSLRDQQEQKDSWAGLFKEKSNQQTSNQSTEDGELQSEKGVTNFQDATTFDTASESVTTDTTGGQEKFSQNYKTIYGQNPIYTKVANPVLPYSTRNTYHGSNHPIQGTDNQQKDWTQQNYMQETYNNQTGQSWNDRCPTQPFQQHQTWSEYQNYHHSTSYLNQQNYIAPPPGFNQAAQQIQIMTGQRLNYQSDIQQTGMHHNTQQGFYDQQSVLYNLQRFIPPPTDTMQNTTNRYQYYGQQKPEYNMYQGNWNANNNIDATEEKGSNAVHYSTQPFDVQSEETNVKDHREKPKYKCRQIRTNLIRIYPSKDKR